MSVCTFHMHDVLHLTVHVREVLFQSLHRKISSPLSANGQICIFICLMKARFSQRTVIPQKVQDSVRAAVVSGIIPPSTASVDIRSTFQCRPHTGRPGAVSDIRRNGAPLARPPGARQSHHPGQPARLRRLAGGHLISATIPVPTLSPDRIRSTAIGGRPDAPSAARFRNGGTIRRRRGASGMQVAC